MNEWVEKASPEIHKFLKSQGKIITSDIKRLLVKNGVNKADNKNKNNEEIAGSILSGYTSDTWARDLTNTMQDLIIKIYLDSGQDAKTELSNATNGEISGSFVRDETFHDYANAYAEKRTAELVGTGKNPAYSLDQSTRDMLRSDLVDMMNEGMTPQEIADSLQENYAFSETRSMMIARSETGFAWNRGAIKMYSESGVKLVYVHDGDYDEDCRAANGQIWSADYAQINALAHPNCVRSFSPCLEPDAQPDEY